MKRLLAVAILMLSVLLPVKVVYAGAPKEQPLPPQGAYYHTQIMGSTATVLASVPLTLAIAPPTSAASGGGTFPYQNCFTRFLVQMSTCSVFTYQDGPVATSTTSWTVYGSGLGTQGPATIAIPEDHLGPLCSQFGNTTTVSISTSTSGTGICVGAANVGNASINYEGFTTAGVGSAANGSR